MTEIVRKISVDLSRRGNTRLIFARQNDRGSRRVSIKLTDCGRPYFVPSGTVATINILRSDGQSAAFAADVTEGGEIEFTLTLWALSAVGEARCSVSLYGGDQRKLTSADFTLDVLDALYSGDDIREDEECGLLTALLSEVSEFKVAEEERQDAEELRALGEGQRNRNESARFVAEEERTSAEEERTNAEDERKNAEASRNAAEDERKNAEASRNAAEDEREAAEILREDGEAARVVAELERAAAEKRREEEILAAKSASGISLEDFAQRFESDNVEGALGELAVRAGSNSEEIKAIKTKIGGVFGTLTLSKGDFDDSLVAVAEIEGAEAEDLITFYPESADDAEIVGNSGLFIVPRAADGRVMFTVKTLPAADLHFCYFIMRGGSFNE